MICLSFLLNIQDSNESPEVKDDGPATESEVSLTSYDMRSSSSQSRDRQQIVEAANHDRSAVLSTGAKLLSEENEKAASKVIKRLNANPSLGEPLLKCLKKMDDNMSEDKVTPIKSLAYLLGFYPIHVPDLKRLHYAFFSKLRSYL